MSGASGDMFPDSYIDYVIKDEEKKMKEHCIKCGKEIKVAIFKGSDVCSENCRKDRDGDTPEARAQVDAGLTAMVNQPKGVNLNSIS